jgi:hypothetical protein
MPIHNSLLFVLVLGKAFLKHFNHFTLQTHNTTQVFKSLLLNRIMKYAIWAKLSLANNCVAIGHVITRIAIVGFFHTFEVYLSQSSQKITYIFFLFLFFLVIIETQKTLQAPSNSSHGWFPWKTTYNLFF